MEDNGSKTTEVDHPFIQVEMVDEGKQIRVTCNISNLTLGLGLLEVAKDFVKQKVAMDNQKKIQSVPGGLINHLRRVL